MCFAMLTRIGAYVIEAIQGSFLLFLRNGMRLEELMGCLSIYISDENISTITIGFVLHFRNYRWKMRVYYYCTMGRQLELDILEEVKEQGSWGQ